MLESRLLDSSATPTVYHYCSAQTLLAICQNKTIRLSDVNMMNDYAESRYGYGVFEEAATELLKDDRIRATFNELDRDFFDRVDEVLGSLQLRTHPVIACFSKRPDVLSQWTRYADEGRGYSVGFDTQLLKRMPVTVIDVEYKRTVQVAEAKAGFVNIFLLSRDEKLTYGSAFRQDCGVFAAMLLSFKSESFSEEQEVRLLHLLDVVTDDERPRLRDSGGLDGQRKVKGQPVKYRVAADGSFIAHVDLPFPTAKNAVMLKEFWSGPKNDSLPGNLIYMVSEYGWKGYELHRSRVTLR